MFWLLPLEGKVAEERSDEDGWGETLMPAITVICRVPGFPSCRTYREMRHLEGKVDGNPSGSDPPRAAITCTMRNATPGMTRNPSLDFGEIRSPRVA